jgi:hypothetical protein
MKRLQLLIKLRERQAMIAAGESINASATLEAATKDVDVSRTAISDVDAALRPAVGEALDAAHINTLLVARTQADMRLRESILRQGSAQAAAQNARAAAFAADAALRRVEFKKESLQNARDKALDAAAQTLNDLMAHRRVKQ